MKHPSLIPHRYGRTSGSILLLVIAISVTLIGFNGHAIAQTWDYSLSSTEFRTLPVPFPLTQGFSYSISGIAVDSKGDIFLGVLGNAPEKDSASGDLYEFEAVNGVVGPESPVIHVLVFGYPQASEVMGVAVDSSGNVYVSDGISTIYEVAATNGAISSTSTVTQYWTGLAVPAGIAVGPNGDLFVANNLGGGVERISWTETGAFRRAFTSPVGAGLVNPFGLEFDPSGNLYVSDTFSGAVSKVTPAGGVFSASSPVTSEAGPFASPGFLTFDRQGNLLVQTEGSRIQEVVAVNGSVSPSSPVLSVAVDLSGQDGGLAMYPDGNILVGTSVGLREIQHPTANFGSVEVGAAGTTMLAPYTFAVPGSVTGWQVSAKGAAGSDFSVFPAQTTCSAGAPYQAGESCSIAVQFAAKRAGARAGALLLTIEDTNDGSVSTATFPLKGVGMAPQVSYPGNRQGITVATGLNHPWGLTADEEGNIYVAESGGNSVKEIVAQNGTLTAGAQIATIGKGFNSPSGVAFDAAGNLYIAVSTDDSIFEIPSAESHSPELQTAILLLPGSLCSSSSLLTAIALDGDGNLLMPNDGEGSFCNGRLFELPSATGQPLSGHGFFLLGFVLGLEHNPYYWGMALDAQGDLFLTDRTNGVILEARAIHGQLTPSSPMAVVGEGFKQPVGIAVDVAGDVFFTDTQEGTVSEMVAANGQVSVDSEVITVASGFKAPYGLTFDAHGNLFVSDNQSGAIVELPLGAPPSLHFATPTTAGQLDETDGPLTATIANSGNQPLNFVLPKTGMNPSISTNFVWDSSSTCEQSNANTPDAFSLASGLSCTIAVRFKPAAGGAIKGQIAITDNSLSAGAPAYAQQTIPLSGAGERAAQTIMFRPIAAHVHAHSTIELFASASSRLAVNFTSKTPKVCSVSGTKVSLMIAGTCTIQAEQAGNSEYLAAQPASHASTVLHASQQISFPGITTREHAGETMALKATANSDLRVSFTSKTPKVCEVSGAEAMLLKAGACTIEAAQNGNATYAAAASVIRSFSVAAAN